MEDQDSVQLYSMSRVHHPPPPHQLIHHDVIIPSSHSKLNVQDPSATFQVTSIITHPPPFHQALCQVAPPDHHPVQQSSMYCFVSGRLVDTKSNDTHQVAPAHPATQSFIELAPDAPSAPSAQLAPPQVCPIIHVTPLHVPPAVPFPLKSNVQFVRSTFQFTFI